MEKSFGVEQGQIQRAQFGAYCSDERALWLELGQCH